jgi:Xaa-Pro aminopeptidase
MRAPAPDKFEYEVEAAIEHVYLKNGAMSWGYPSIVGSGPNATILHYSKSNRRMDAGDLLLVDAAGNLEGYTGDITRTYPVTGKFTSTQREIYQIVLAAQEAGIAAAKTGTRFSDIQAACDDVLRAGLVRAWDWSPIPRASSSRFGQPTACRTGSEWRSMTSPSRGRSVRE